MQLCQALQTLLHLPEPPLFLVPCYTASLDRWLHPYTQQLHIAAEAYPRVWRYRGLLNAVFETPMDHWQMIKAPVEACDPAVIESYQPQFPQLWQNHNLVIRLDQLSAQNSANTTDADQTVNQPDPRVADPAISIAADNSRPQGYVLRLFVASHHTSTTRILENLHRLLDQVLDVPYTLKVIDVTKHPDRAEADQIAATPTLVKVWPEPVRRLVGDQLATDTVLQLLDATSSDTTASAQDP